MSTGPEVPVVELHQHRSKHAESTPIPPIHYHLEGTADLDNLLTLARTELTRRSLTAASSLPTGKGRYPRIRYPLHG